MNMNNFVGLASAGGALLIAVALIAILARRRARRITRLLVASDEMRKMLESMQADLAHIKEEPPLSAPEPAPAFAPAPLLTADQRAGALEMLRRGANAADVSASMGISGPEAELLHRVQRFLDAAPSLS